MSIIALGTIAIDNIKVDSIDKRNLLGGSAAHFAMSARFFTKVSLAGIVGTDFPKEHFKLFADKKIDISAVVRKEGKTFCWHGEYKKGDYNHAITLKTELGVITEYKPKLTLVQKNMPNVFLANLDPESQLAFLSEMKNPKMVGLDSMNLWIANNRPTLMKLIKKVDIFFVNDGEACQLTNEHNCIKAINALRKLGPKYIILKKGEHGVLVCGNKTLFSFPAYHVERVIDPTGAGDTFAGGVMGYLSKAGKINEKILKEATLYATTFSSFNVEGFGMERTARLSPKDVKARLNKLIKFISPK